MKDGCSMAPTNEKLNKFFCYFDKQWLENDEIPIEFRNCHIKQHRTNNSIEEWNHKVNSYLGRSHLRVKYLLDCLKKEGENCNLLFKGTEFRLEGTKRKKCYVK